MNPRVLVVEDDSFYAQLVSELLGDVQIAPTVVHNAENALAEDSLDYKAAVIDVMLPNDPNLSGITDSESRAGFNTGICVARRLLARNPQMRIILLSSDEIGGEAEQWTASRPFTTFVRKSGPRAALVDALQKLGIVGERRMPLAFIVHGHDDLAVFGLKDYLQNALGWREPIVLREQPNAGKTIIEKFETLGSQADIVFVLLAPHDLAVSSGSNDEKRRSRQNVIFELGYFCGAFGRTSGRVLLLHKGDVELPSDIAGVVWIDIGAGIKSAGEAIRREVSCVFGPMEHA